MSDSKLNGEKPETYKLTYFKYRGTAEPIRVMFKVAGVEFEDHRVEWDDAWNEEHKKKYPWGTLPVLTYGDVVLCHQVPIARFLARKFDLIGSDEIEAARCDELVEAMRDVREEAMKVFVETDPANKEKVRSRFLNITAPCYLARFEKTYQANEGDWMVGSKLSWADIYIVYSIEYLESTLGEKIIIPSYPGLMKLKEAVHAVPQIKEWIENRPAGSY